MWFVAHLVILCCATALVVAEPLPPGTNRTGGMRNQVLVYLDSRSVGPNPIINMSSEAWKTLLIAPSPSSSSSYNGSSTILFDAALITGLVWNGKHVWPTPGEPQMNRTDWEGLQDLWFEQGVRAAAEARRQTNCSQLPPTTLYITCPYPSPLQYDFGAVTNDGPSLNFTLEADRITAVKWIVDRAVQRWQNLSHELDGNVELGGIYWFYEEMLTNDINVTKALSLHLKNISFHSRSISASPLLLGWIPYFETVYFRPSSLLWKQYGFDWATLQPNFAFQSVKPSERFPVVEQLISNASMGIELELPLAVLNKDLHPVNEAAMKSFFDYLAAAKEYHWHRKAFKTYYNGNSFVDMAWNLEGNRTQNAIMWQALVEFVLTK